MGRYLGIVRQASIEQKQRAKQYGTELHKHPGVQMIRLGELPALDILRAIPAWSFRQVEEAVRFGYAVKLWSKIFEAQLFLVADELAKEKPRNYFLTEEVAIFTLAELELLVKSRLVPGQLQAHYNMNLILGASVVAHTDLSPSPLQKR